METMWNWQTKIEHVRRIYEESVSQYSIDNEPRSVNDSATPPIVTEVAESNWSTPKEVSESLVRIIDYSEFNDTYQAPPSSIIDPDDLYISLDSTRINSNTTADENVPVCIRKYNKCDIASNSKYSYRHSERVLHLLQLAKENIVKLIDDQIQLFRDKTNLAQLREDEERKQFEIAEAIKTAERQECIRRIRNELTTKMDNLNKLLNDLDEKC